MSSGSFKQKITGEKEGFMGEAIQPISVKSLKLPQGIEGQIVAIAKGGPTKDLDTLDEFRQANQFLTTLESASQQARVRLMTTPGVIPHPQISASSVIVKEGDGLIEYRIDVQGRILLRNVRWEEWYTLYDGSQKAQAYTFGRAVKLATDGTNVYVLLQWNDPRPDFLKAFQIVSHIKEHQRVYEFADADPVFVGAEPTNPSLQDLDIVAGAIVGKYGTATKGDLRTAKLQEGYHRF